MTATAEQQWLSPPQIAELLGVAHLKILRFIRNGELRAFDLSSRRGERPRWKISPSDLESFLARRAATPPPTPVRRKRKRTDGVIQFYE